VNITWFYVYGRIVGFRLRLAAGPAILVLLQDLSKHHVTKAGVQPPAANEHAGQSRSLSAIGYRKAAG
jgi:hypothetical protein